MAPARLVDQFDSRAELCSCVADLRRLLGQAVRELGFDYFALLHHASLTARGKGLIWIDNYPDGWVHELTVGAYCDHDPVHLASGRTNTGFAWERLGSLVPLTLQHRRILERSGRFGMGPGFTVPANVPGEPGGSCSFAVRRGRTLPARHLH